jgi:transcriptional regulator GlxA family with amidase domain
VIVSAGISAGIDMSLHVVARLLGLEQAIETARYMEYEWRSEDSHLFGSLNDECPTTDQGFRKSKPVN